MGFDVHGKYCFSIQGQIIKVKAFQTWNLECSQKFFEDYQLFVLAHKLQKFGAIADLRQFEGGTPEAITDFGRISQWAYDNGQIARAQVIDSQLKGYTLEKPNDGKTIFPIQNFDNVSQAMTWLASLGLAVN